MKTRIIKYPPIQYQCLKRGPLWQSLISFQNSLSIHFVNNLVNNQQEKGTVSGTRVEHSQHPCMSVIDRQIEAHSPTFFFLFTSADDSSCSRSGSGRPVLHSFSPAENVKGSLRFCSSFSVPDSWVIYNQVP